MMVLRKKPFGCKHGGRSAFSRADRPYCSLVGLNKFPHGKRLISDGSTVIYPVIYI
jgi:hypothetical protein